MTTLYDRVYVNTVTTGQGTVTLGSAFSDAFLTDVEASIANAAALTVVIEEGSDFEIVRGVYTSATRTLTRATVLKSKISGTAGTTKMTLNGGATVRVVAVAEDIIYDGYASTTATIGVGTIQLSNAAANTLTASAGVLSINSDTIYQEGGIDVAVADGGTGQSTEAEALGEMTQALTEDTTPDIDTDMVPVYDDSADTGKKVKLQNLSKAPTTQIFTASGTYTKPTNPSPRFVKVTIAAGGGGGGGAALAGASNLSLGSGGGAGGVSIEWLAIASVGTTETVTVGTGGAGGVGAAGGSAGNTSSFGALLSATGGAIGGTVAGGTTATISAGGLNGVGSGGNLNFGGVGTGGYWVRISGTIGMSGPGGSCILGIGGRGRPSTGNGFAGESYGGGGSGAADQNTLERTGGAGANGIVFVEEFY